MPEIAVIIPTFNGAKFLPETLGSVLAQGGVDLRVILVDDGSSDDTVDVASRYSQGDCRITLVQQQNGGVAAARNRGFHEVSPSTDYVCFLDQDDLLECGALALLIKRLEEHPAAPAVHGVARYIDETSALSRPGQAESLVLERCGIVGTKLVSRDRQLGSNFSVFAYRNCLWTPGQVVVRAESLRQLNQSPFDPLCAPADDWDLWIRLSRIGEIVLVDKVVLRYRLHSSNVSRDMKGMRRAELQVRAKHLRDRGLSSDERKIFLSGYRYSERGFGWQWLSWAMDCARRCQFILAAKVLRRSILFFFRGIPGVPFWA